MASHEWQNTEAGKSHLMVWGKTPAVLQGSKTCRKMKVVLFATK